MGVNLRTYSIFVVFFVLLASRAEMCLADDAMKAAINAQLAMRGYGKLCIDGPISEGAFTVSADDPAEEKAKAKELQTLGFVRVASTAPNPLDSSLDTVYNMTDVGKRYFSSYNKLSLSGHFNGWCFAEFRVGRIARNTTPAEFMGHRLTTVTYYPHVIHVEKWAIQRSAAGIPEIRALRSFESTPRTQTLQETSDGWQGTASE